LRLLVFRLFALGVTVGGFAQIKNLKSKIKNL